MVDLSPGSTWLDDDRDFWQSHIFDFTTLPTCFSFPRFEVYSREAIFYRSSELDTALSSMSMEMVFNIRAAMGGTIQAWQEVVINIVEGWISSKQTIKQQHDKQADLITVIHQQRNAEVASVFYIVDQAALQEFETNVVNAINTLQDAQQSKAAAGLVMAAAFFATCSGFLWTGSAIFAFEPEQFRVINSLNLAAGLTSTISSVFSVASAGLALPGFNVDHLPSPVVPFNNLSLWSTNSMTGSETMNVDQGKWTLPTVQGTVASSHTRSLTALSTLSPSIISHYGSVKIQSSSDLSSFDMGLLAQLDRDAYRANLVLTTFSANWKAVCGEVVAVTHGCDAQPDVFPDGTQFHFPAFFFVPIVDSKSPSISWNNSKLDPFKSLLFDALGRNSSYQFLFWQPQSLYLSPTDTSPIAQTSSQHCMSQTLPVDPNDPLAPNTNYKCRPFCSTDLGNPSYPTSNIDWKLSQLDGVSSDLTDLPGSLAAYLIPDRQILNNPNYVSQGWNINAITQDSISFCDDLLPSLNAAETFAPAVLQHTGIAAQSFVQSVLGMNSSTASTANGPRTARLVRFAISIAVRNNLTSGTSRRLLDSSSFINTFRSEFSLLLAGQFNFNVSWIQINAVSGVDGTPPLSSSQISAVAGRIIPTQGASITDQQVAFINQTINSFIQSAQEIQIRNQQIAFLASYVSIHSVSLSKGQSLDSFAPVPTGIQLDSTILDQINSKQLMTYSSAPPQPCATVVSSFMDPRMDIAAKWANISFVSQVKLQPVDVITVNSSQPAMLMAAIIPPPSPQPEDYYYLSASSLGLRTPPPLDVDTFSDPAALKLLLAIYSYRIHRQYKEQSSVNGHDDAERGVLPPLGRILLVNASTGAVNPLAFSSLTFHFPVAVALAEQQHFLFVGDLVDRKVHQVQLNKQNTDSIASTCWLSYDFPAPIAIELDQRKTFLYVIDAQLKSLLRVAIKTNHTTECDNDDDDTSTVHLPDPCFRIQLTSPQSFTLSPDSLSAFIVDRVDGLLRVNLTSQQVESMRVEQTRPRVTDVRATPQVNGSYSIYVTHADNSVMTRIWVRPTANSTTPSYLLDSTSLTLPSPGVSCFALFWRWSAPASGPVSFDAGPLVQLFGIHTLSSSFISLYVEAPILYWNVSVNRLPNGVCPDTNNRTQSWNQAPIASVGTVTQIQIDTLSTSNNRSHTSSTQQSSTGIKLEQAGSVNATSGVGINDGNNGNIDGNNGNNDGNNGNNGHHYGQNRNDTNNGQGNGNGHKSARTRHLLSESSHPAESSLLVCPRPFTAWYLPLNSIPSSLRVALLVDLAIHSSLYTIDHPLNIAVGIRQQLATAMECAEERIQLQHLQLTQKKPANTAQKKQSKLSTTIVDPAAASVNDSTALSVTASFDLLIASVTLNSSANVTDFLSSPSPTTLIRSLISRSAVNLIFVAPFEGNVSVNGEMTIIATPINCNSTVNCTQSIQLANETLISSDASPIDPAAGSLDGSVEVASSSHIALLVGAIVGAVATVLVIAGGVIFFHRRRLSSPVAVIATRAERYSVEPNQPTIGKRKQIDTNVFNDTLAIARSTPPVINTLVVAAVSTPLDAADSSVADTTDATIQLSNAHSPRKGCSTVQLHE